MKNLITLKILHIKANNLSVTRTMSTDRVDSSFLLVYNFRCFAI
jgi:hypothetical protein